MKKCLKLNVLESTADLYTVEDLLNQASLYTSYCSCTVLYVTLWKCVNKTTYREPSNPPFIKLKALKSQNQLQNINVRNFQYICNQ